MPWLPQLHMKAGTFRIARTRSDDGKPLVVNAITPPALTEKYLAIDSSWPQVERLWCLAQLMPTNLTTAVGVIYSKDTAAYKRIHTPPPNTVMNGKPHVKLIRRGSGAVVNDNIYALGDDQSTGSIQYPQSRRGAIINSLYAVSIADENRAVVVQNQPFVENYPTTTRYPYLAKFVFYVMVFRP